MGNTERGNWSEVKTLAGMAGFEAKRRNGSVELIPIGREFADLYERMTFKSVKAARNWLKKYLAM